MCLLCNINQMGDPQRLNRRTFITGAIAGAFIPQTVTAEKLENKPKPTNIISPDVALQRLLDGNQRFLNGNYKKRRESVPLNRFNLASKGGAKVYRSC